MAAKQITFEIEIDDNGDAFIRLPEGPGQQGQAAKVADLTEAIANELGTIAERHVGDHHHGIHGHHHHHDHHQTT